MVTLENSNHFLSFLVFCDSKIQTTYSRAGFFLVHGIWGLSCKTWRLGTVVIEIALSHISGGGCRCWLELGWGCLQENPHVTSLLGLSFPTTWWLNSKRGRGKKKEGQSGRIIIYFWSSFGSHIDHVSLYHCLRQAWVSVQIQEERT